MYQWINSYSGCHGTAELLHYIVHVSSFSTIATHMYLYTYQNHVIYGIIII